MKGTKPCAKPGRLGQMVILCKSNSYFLQIFVDLNKEYSNENKQRMFIQNLLYSKRVCHSRLGVAEIKSVEYKHLIVEEREGFRSAPPRACWHGEFRGAGHPA